MNIVNTSVRFISLLVKRVYFGVSKTPWRLSTTRSAVSLTLCSTFPVLVQVLWKLFLSLVRTANGRTVASSFSLTVRNTQEIRKHGTITMKPHFPWEWHEEGPATQALMLHLMAGMPCLGDGVDRTRDILSEEFKNFTDQLRTVTSQQDRCGNGFISDWTEPRAGQKWDRKIQINLSNSYFFDCLLCAKN